MFEHLFVKIDHGALGHVGKRLVGKRYVSLGSFVQLVILLRTLKKKVFKHSQKCSQWVVVRVWPQIVDDRSCLALI